MYGDRVCITYMYTVRIHAHLQIVRIHAHLQIAMHCSVRALKIPSTYTVKCKRWIVYTYHSDRTQIMDGQTIIKLSGLPKENAYFDLE